jgi:hypothetical protein
MGEAMSALKHSAIGLLAVVLFPIWFPLAVLYAIGVLIVCMGEVIAREWL